MNAFTAYTGSGARWPPLLNALESNDRHPLREAFPQLLYWSTCYGL